MPPVAEHVFADGAALAQALARAVAADLAAGIAARGAAVLAVPGGATPRRFLDALAAQPLAWERVTLTLTDERRVPADDARSNERLLRETLLAVAPARFVPLRGAAVDADAELAEVAARIAALPLPFDAVVLGMGEDGHCASLLPDGDRLAAALDPAGAARVLPMRAPSVPEPRLTLTLPALTATRALYLHIEGAAKRAVLARALAAPASAPVARVLAHARVRPQVFWCP